MSLSASQRAAWDALGLGPLWVARGASEDAAEPAGEAAGFPAEPAEAAASMSRVELSTDDPAGPVSPPVSGEAQGRTGRPGAPIVPPVPRTSSMPQASQVSQASPASPVDAMDWPALRDSVAACERCGLCRSRSRTVFGSGLQTSPWMIVGEAPGAEEDARGEPFVGQAGRLLENMLAALGLSRERDVFITNVLKCRPPGNRNPEPDEVRECAPYLRRQVELLAPSGILVMGRFAAQTLLDTEATIASLRGRVHAYRSGERELPMVVTYHPAYLLRNLPDKAKAWADLCLARSRFGALG